MENINSYNMDSPNSREITIHCGNILLVDGGAVCESSHGLPINMACTFMNILLGILLYTDTYKNENHFRTLTADILINNDAVDYDTQIAFIDPMDAIKILENEWDSIAKGYCLTVEIYDEGIIPIQIGGGTPLSITLYYEKEHYRLVVPKNKQPKLLQINFAKIIVNDKSNFPHHFFNPDNELVIKEISNQIQYPSEFLLEEKDNMYFSLKSLLKKINRLDVRIEGENDLSMLSLFDEKDHWIVLNYIFEQLDNGKLPKNITMEKQGQIYFPTALLLAN